jgi:DNA mismatch repair ATPase MutS
MAVSLELLSMLKHRDLSSAALADLRAQLDCQKEFGKVKLRIAKITEYCQNKNISLDIEYGSGFKFKSAEIYPVEKAPENPENKTNNPILKIFQSKKAKEQEKETGDGFYYGDHFIVENEINSMLGGALTYVLGIIRDVNRHILAFCDALGKQLSFYIAALDIVKLLENNNVPPVFPEVRGGQSQIKAKNLRDFGLVLQKAADENPHVTPNDFDGDGSSYYLISGANRGGKTTFLKSAGIAQLFAQSGLPVPAERYFCPVFSNFFSHFPKDEDEDLNFGKLAEELMRIKKAMPKIADNALVLLNESFSTTTETEGCDFTTLYRYA